MSNGKKAEKGQQQIYLSLQPSEMAVFRGAAAIYAAYVSTGKVTDGKESAYIQKSIKEAIQLAYHVENYVISDAEIDEREVLR